MSTTMASAATDLRIETGGGVLTSSWKLPTGGCAGRVDMGEPILDAARIPTTLPGDPVVDAVPSEGCRPHAVRHLRIDGQSALRHVRR